MTLEIQRRCGTEVNFLAWRLAGEDRIARLAVQFQEEAVGRAALAAALAVVAAAGQTTLSILRDELERCARSRTRCGLVPLLRRLPQRLKPEAFPSTAQ